MNIDNVVLTHNGKREFSIPDKYATLLETLDFFNTKGFNIYLGKRLEGIPSSDLIGRSTGYRWPGYVISQNSDINYSAQNLTACLNVSIALE